MVQQKQAATWTENAPHFPIRLAMVWNAAQRERTYDGVERLVVERLRFGVRELEIDALAHRERERSRKLKTQKFRMREQAVAELEIEQVDPSNSLVAI
jgi:hypothetical protein